MIARTLEETEDPCELSHSLTIAIELAEKLVTLVALLKTFKLANPYFLFGASVVLRIISAYRHWEHEQEISTTPPQLSNHTICPARAVDIDLPGVSSVADWLTVGRLAEQVGLRWGGGCASRRTGHPNRERAKPFRPGAEDGPDRDGLQSWQGQYRSGVRLGRNTRLANEGALRLGAVPGKVSTLPSPIV